MACFAWLFALVLLGWTQACSPPPGAKNLARDKLTCQSSTLESPLKPESGLAIDGNTANELSQGSCAHTNFENEPWWKIDLQNTYKIGTIVVTNRKDCCEKRLDGAEVRIGNSPNLDNPVCGTICDMSKLTNTLCCNGMEGRYVSVVIPGRSEYLTLCEVEIYEYAEEEEDIECIEDEGFVQQSL
ncbi:pentraxin fusion protein-like [Discoglossus pictus]